MSDVRRIGGWLLVIFGIAIAAFGFVLLATVGIPTPQEERLRADILGLTFMALGILMIIVGRIVLGKKKSA